MGLRGEGEGDEPVFPSLACGLFRDFSKRVVEKFKKGSVPSLRQLLHSSVEHMIPEPNSYPLVVLITCRPGPTDI